MKRPFLAQPVIAKLVEWEILLGYASLTQPTHMPAQSAMLVSHGVHDQTTMGADVHNINDNQDTYIDNSFKNIELRDTEINAKEFDNCTFSGCNFSDTAFVNCKFYECKFINCNLSMISVMGCSFFDVVFEDSKLIGINWTKASWPRIKLSSPFRFDKCILNNSSFYGLGLKEIAIIECKAKEVDFRECDCSEADFTHTDFENSLFGKTNLTKADFSEAANYNIDLFNNVVKNAKFSMPDAINLLNCLEIEINDY